MNHPHPIKFSFRRASFIRGIVFSIVLLGLAPHACFANPIVVPTIEVHTLSHEYVPSLPLPFPPPPIIGDVIEIGSGYTGGGAFSVPSISNGDTVSIRVQAPAGQKFVIHDAAAQLRLNMYWQAGGDVSSLAGGTVSFENLVGAPPTNTYTFLAVGSSGNAITAHVEYQPAGLIEFTAMDITIPVQTFPPGGPRNFASVQSSSSYAFGALVYGGPDRTVMSLEPVAVPEPAAVVFVAVAMAAGAITRRR